MFLVQLTRMKAFSLLGLIANELGVTALSLSPFRTVGGRAILLLRGWVWLYNWRQPVPHLLQIPIDVDQPRCIFRQPGKVEGAHRGYAGLLLVAASTLPLPLFHIQ